MCPLEPERRMRLSGPPTHRHMIKVVEASGTEASAHLHRSSRFSMQHEPVQLRVCQDEGGYDMGFYSGYYKSYY